MNDQIRQILEQYNSELFKVGINPQKSENYCGMVGCKGLEDEKTQLSHIAWMIQDFLDNDHDESEIQRGLGFIQGVLWCAKFRGILELEKENR